MWLVTIRVNRACYFFIVGLCFTIAALGIWAEWPNVDWRGVAHVAITPFSFWTLWQAMKITLQIFSQEKDL